MKEKTALSNDSAMSNDGLQVSTGSETKLETEFTFHGHHLQQVWRKSDVAVFERSLKKSEPAHEFELVIIRARKECTLQSGCVLRAGEAYPSNSDWGQYAWSFPVRERALVFEIAESLVNRGEASARAIVVRAPLRVIDTPTTPALRKLRVSQKCDKPHSPAVKPADVAGFQAQQAKCERRQAATRQHLELALAGSKL